MSRFQQIKRGTVKHRTRPEAEVSQLNVYCFNYEAQQKNGQRIPGTVKVAADNQDNGRAAALSYAREAHGAIEVHLRDGGSTLLSGVDVVAGDSSRVGILRKSADLAHEEVSHLRQLVSDLEAKVEGLEAELAAKAEGLGAAVAGEAKKIVAAVKDEAKKL